MINDYEATQPITTDAVTARDVSMSNDDVISTLNGLIQICKDGQEGFAAAAAGVNATNLKSLFSQFSLQRAAFAGELQQTVAKLGGEAETAGTLSGAIHRGWMDLKTALASNEEKPVLNECERGEDGAKKAYLDALENALPADIRNTVESQFAAIRSAHDQIKVLRDAANKESASSAGAGF
jgi:uncharacterized protein (TIGR02284 family)